jgi:putative nucleotidyltransferase with HDIG domain
MLPNSENPAVLPGPIRESAFLGHHFSEPAATNLALQSAFKGKDALLTSIPSIPAVLETLLNELDQPADTVNLFRVADIIGRDESLAAQCLRMANSALFSRGPASDSLRGAVRTLGIARIRDIAVSCGLIRIASASKGSLDPVVFWQHSLACAIMSRKLARSVGFGDPEKAYLAGLMHDIGYIVNLIVLPEKSSAVMERAQREGLFPGQVEYSDLGFTHCQSGEILARQWRLPDAQVEVILCHHDAAAAVVNPALVAIVSLSDRLGRASGLGFGYAEAPDSLDSWEADWKILIEKCPLAAEITWSEFAKESANYVGEIHKLVDSMYAGG